MRGWAGKILRVDLNKGEIEKELVPESLARDFIGGRGWAARIMMEEMDFSADPLSPDNVLIFGTGPLTGTGAIGASRYTVSCKSPLTLAVASSNAGGYFPSELKYAGWDMIILKGKSSEPVYLYINDENVELRPAGEIWGKTTGETETLLKEELGPAIKIACIGPAGENQVLVASVVNDGGRAAGRSGVGAVMGSKKLKAIVVRGTRGVHVAKPDDFRSEMLEIAGRVREMFKRAVMLYQYGTSYAVDYLNKFGIYPSYNFRTGVFPEAEKIGGEALVEKLLVRPKSCMNCPSACGRVTRLAGARWSGKGEGPEYETLFAFGGCCGVNDIEAIAKANYICNEMGMDTISAGTTIACAMELAERGIIPEKDVGFKLRFGDADAIVSLTEKMALRRDFGDVLADGSFRLAQRYGHPEFFMGSKRQEFAGYDPRGAQGMGLNYATGTRGACHIRGDVAYQEVFGYPIRIDPDTTENKAEWVVKMQDLTAVIDSAGLCIFNAMRFLVDYNEKRLLSMLRLARVLDAATGSGLSEEDLWRAGERIFQTERVLVIRAGYGPADDTLPRRMLTEPMPEGPHKGNVCRLGEMLPRYYELRDWGDDGMPSPERLKELGIY